ncbi:MAG: sigma-70 family RNA polymerase sigma factor [Planctomycetes bacterium]|nr:sigma-70 family RNA polymerase sigma factor [Planctomycetota bacterium]MCH9725511.1 sigma-70 family RNA polymerase sigma factor [Planctomycetota bacterium]MCH9776496.1 sigma-70 family RNA polymerase sigma factor [Planctomycetota bacterium]MCH9790463.1 sigma-70 family RNA polymerase sigma factor [Planctomycetota bacterium]MDF1742125.1 sigma-70 family RNA polymerase sigma factor [Gimesia sp.]
MKSPVPDTRNSLILRLPDKHDVEAWDQFVSIYEPLVYRLARSKGLQDADAREVVQEVLVSVSRAIEQWEFDPERGRFRDWLFRIARNLMIKFMTRRKHRPIGTGDSGIAQMLEQHADPVSEEESERFDLEYRREVFRWAAEQVQEQVKERTWQAFWLSSIEGHQTEDVALKLEMSVGAIHIARSRIRSRLREAIKTLEQDNTENISSHNAR